ncbi:DUF294 nucleotidyltransferase-like domain-containing protein [Arenibacter sp. GZD96]|uniref:DUF294 nucleotidyltransferase-like domain-containing protein n=1 Tax=Aurantibrevibacter litoralis TaxID=3106030 RepID=UPI002AFF38B3|nr:DUF294 nucleotidyltransferase-like domain-containing protein [Arenibacter sp. GZD-96]MEA1787635.1 DUF294 nucleotidyltransferase-like domain-containing protein [Arenibacter sp. GZD-96]
MQNIISERVADFLKKFPPFYDLGATDLANLALEISIVYQEKESVVFHENEPPHACFYVVNKGAIALKKNNEAEMLDICDEGDIFGLRPLIANENYQISAKAHEESILYAIPISVFKPYIVKNREVGNFLMESFASNTRNPYSKSYRNSFFKEGISTVSEESPNRLWDLQPIKYSKKIVCCSPETEAKSIAKTMTAKRVGAMMVVQNKLPIGIITDKDLRNQIVTGVQSIDTAAKHIMTSPVITYPKKMTITQAQMAMMKSGISHLCLTKDGTPNTEIVGVLSKHDIMVALGNNPAVLLKAIKRAKKIKSIKPIRNSIMNLLSGYLDQNIPMTLISKIISELNDACVKQIISLSLSEMPTAPPVKFAWLAMGSQGRSEQLLHTDQDNALVFENVAESHLEQTKSYFLKLAEKVTKGLRTIGYEYCPAEMMASNPKWCLSLGEWTQLISHWITNPGTDEVLLSSIFFDYNLSYGDVQLVNALSEHIFEITKKYPIFYTHLAAGALQNPSPTGFFRQFLVEQDGEKKDTFDVKRRALMPLTDAARVLILSHAIKSINNTSERFEKLAALEPNNEELYLACSYATKALIKFRTKQGLLHNDSGRFIVLESLTKEEKVKLKRTFKTIKEIQELVSLRFKVSTLIR